MQSAFFLNRAYLVHFESGHVLLAELCAIFESFSNLIHYNNLYLQVPLSYLRFQEVISEEVIQYRTNGQPAILNQKEFAALAQRIPNNDILDLEELSVGG